MEIISLLAVFSSTFVGLFYFNKFKNTTYKYFLYFLIYTSITELFGILFGYILLIYNVFIYNIYTIIVFIFYFSFYKLLFKTAKFKKLMNYFLIVFLLFTVFDLVIFKTPFFKESFSKIFVFGAILLIITLVLFLIEIINNKQAVFKIKNTLIFWISIGVLLFFIGVIPVMVMVEYLNFEGLFDIVLSILNPIMYGSFILGFIWSKEKYNYL